jgi:hypothetical protein
VGVGEATGVVGIIATSTNKGVSWTTQAHPISVSVADIAYNGSRWIAVGNGSSHTIAYSDNLTSWTGAGKSVITVVAFGVGWVGDKWVALGFGTNHLAYSSNGVTWTGLGSSLFVSNGQKVKWNESNFIKQDGPVIINSPDQIIIPP